MPDTPTPESDDFPLLSRNACRALALDFRQTIGTHLNIEDLTNQDIPQVQLALTASLLYAVMALDQDRPA